MKNDWLWRMCIRVIMQSYMQAKWCSARYNALLKVSLNIPFFGLEEYGMQKELRKRLVSVHNLIENFEIARKR